MPVNLIDEVTKYKFSFNFAKEDLVSQEKKDEVKKEKVHKFWNSWYGKAYESVKSAIEKKAIISIYIYICLNKFIIIL